jgi:hypothetical protein
VSSSLQPGASLAPPASAFWEARCRDAEAALAELRQQAGAARAEAEARMAAARKAWDAERRSLERWGCGVVGGWASAAGAALSKASPATARAALPLPFTRRQHLGQIKAMQGSAKEQLRAARDKAKVQKARAAALASEVTALRLELHERACKAGAGLQGAGSPPLLPAPLQAGGCGHEAFSPGFVLSGVTGCGAAAGEASPSRADLLAAIAGIRQRQEAYLSAV